MSNQWTQPCAKSVPMNQTIDARMTAPPMQGCSVADALTTLQLVTQSAHEAHSRLCERLRPVLIPATSAAAPPKPYTGDPSCDLVVALNQTRDELRLLADSLNETIDRLAL